MCGEVLHDHEYRAKDARLYLNEMFDNCIHAWTIGAYISSPFHIIHKSHLCARIVGIPRALVIGSYTYFISLYTSACATFFFLGLTDPPRNIF